LKNIENMPGWSTRPQWLSLCWSNVFGGLLFRDLKQVVNADRRVLLHSRQDTAVEVGRDTDPKVTHETRGTLGTPQSRQSSIWTLSQLTDAQAAAWMHGLGSG
jgi:hypothetical protein